MRTRKDYTNDDAEQYGFRWGPMDVVRQAEFNGSHLVAVRSDYASVDIYVSKTGRSIRVFKDGLELKVDKH
jgi:hypothetical protein